VIPTRGVEPLTSAIGARVRGINLARDLDDATVATVRRALLDHLVIFFEDQELTPAQHYAFSERLGPTMLSVIDTQSTEQPGVTVLDQVAPKGQFTDQWHTDHSFVEEPPMATTLRAVQLPSVGGDTCFASMYAAYDALSPSLQGYLDGLSALHSIEQVAASTSLDGVYRRDAEEHIPPVVHPVVRVHPETGRKLLYVCGNFTARIVGLHHAESAALLNFLFAHINRSEFHCRYKWRPGSLAIWDNRSAQHLAVPDYKERRIMHRTMVAGDRPFGPSDRPSVNQIEVPT
jgi:taurine dioxygenase